MELINKKHIKILALWNSECYMNGVGLSENIAKSNKLFVKATELLKNMTDELNAHSINLVRVDENYSEDMPLHAVLLYLETMCGVETEYDAIVLITNQKCYLMNDEGKTIERLV